MKKRKIEEEIPFTFSDEEEENLEDIPLVGNSPILPSPSTPTGEKEKGVILRSTAVSDIFSGTLFQGVFFVSTDVEFIANGNS